jgi:lipopolysaccharide/colanic/teichoic acid biosynthesis glycosyltransferase
MLRFFDILFSAIGIILLSPLLIIISIYVYFDSRGPIIYMQKRVGRNGKDFCLYKFRSMYVNSENNGLITIGKRDPRITRSGYILRQIKLDELPQLFNVFKGDMSFVGPRPEVRKYVDLYTPIQKEVLSVRPGITDYASIKFSNENELLSGKKNPEEYYINFILPKKIRLNLVYISNRNLFQYFRIIILTIFKGAILNPGKRR